MKNEVIKAIIAGLESSPFAARELAHKGNVEGIVTITVTIGGESETISLNTDELREKAHDNFARNKRAHHLLDKELERLAKIDAEIEKENEEAEKKIGEINSRYCDYDIRIYTITDAPADAEVLRAVGMVQLAKAADFDGSPIRLYDEQFTGWAESLGNEWTQIPEEFLDQATVDNFIIEVRKAQK